MQVGDQETITIQVIVYRDRLLPRPMVKTVITHLRFATVFDLKLEIQTVVQFVAVSYRTFWDKPFEYLFG